MPKQFFLMTITLLIIFSSNLWARKPAVDNVIGIEATDFKANPENRLIKFDFGTATPLNAAPTIPWVHAIATFLVLGLPILISSVISRKKSHTVIETTNNVLVLTQKKVTKTSDEESDKKAA